MIYMSYILGTLCIISPVFSKKKERIDLRRIALIRISFFSSTFYNYFPNLLVPLLLTSKKVFDIMYIKQRLPENTRPLFFVADSRTIAFWDLGHIYTHDIMR